MRVTFVLPAPVRIPMGGPQVVYRHAEGLVARGHRVSVVCPPPGLARRAAVWVRDRAHGAGTRPYYAAPGVETLEGASVPDGDAVVATGWQTVARVATLPPSNGVGFYLLQHDERVMNPRAGETWAAPLHRIAVAAWIAAEVEQAGAPVLGVVPNAVDPARWAVDLPLDRRPRRVVALYHRHESKGPDVLVKALAQLVGWGVAADVVSARRPSHRLPRGVRLHLRPSPVALRALYNGAAVVLHTSRLEGWGLVPMEAAACGCAVVATASRGVDEFLRAGHSMVQVPVGDAAAVAHAARELLVDDARRLRLAEAARADVSRFSWWESTDRLEALLLKGVEQGRAR